MFSILNKRKSNDPTGVQIRQIYSEIGFAGLWRGLGVRTLMITSITMAMFVIVDTYKIWCGLETMGGK